jgi:hypothetical protein
MKIRVTLNDWQDHGIYIEINQQSFSDSNSAECKRFIEYCWTYLSEHMLADFQIENEEYWR